MEKKAAVAEKDKTVGYYVMKGSQRRSMGKNFITIVCEDCGYPQEVHLWSFAGCGRRCEECQTVIGYRKNLGEL